MGCVWACVRAREGAVWCGVGAHLSQHLTRSAKAMYEMPRPKESDVSGQTRCS